MRKAALAWLLLTLATSNARAEACFCLTHPTTDAIVRYGCTAIVPANRFTPIVRCLAPDRRGAKQLIDEPGRWLRLAGGEGACNPCAPGPDAPVPDVPRELDRGEAAE